MPDLSNAMSLRRLLTVSVLAAVLLGIRFFYSATAVSLRLSPGTLAIANWVFETYEFFLPFVLFAMILLIALSWRSPPTRAFSLSIIVFHLVVLIVWLYYLDPLDSRAAKSLFPIVSVIAVASGSLLSLGFASARGISTERWQEWAYLAILVLVPVIFALRAATILGVGTSPGPTGALQGNWFLVYTPTILLELLAIWVWLNLVLSSERSKLRRRWYSFLPFAIPPLSMAAFALRPLSGFILSALVTWGSNLALFVPAPLSLTLTVTSFACYLSTFILLERENNRVAWRLLFVGSSTVILSGFYLSMASVEGLTLGLVIIAVSMTSWKQGSHVP